MIGSYDSRISMKGIPLNTKTSLTVAGKLYKSAQDGEMSEWKTRQRERHTTQLMYVDSIVPIYQQIMNALPPQKRKVMAIIVGAYKGITPTEIAKRGFLDMNTVTSQVGNLHKAGLVDRRRMGRKSIYWVRDRDFLLFYAMRADHAWRTFYEERRDRYDEALIDEFITQQNRG